MAAHDPMIFPPSVMHEREELWGRDWIALPLELSISVSAYAQLSNTYRIQTHLFVPQGWNYWFTFLYIQKLLLTNNRSEWMKGICHIWSRGRHFSPSLPGDRYLNLGSKSDFRAEISGSIVWYDALAPRPEVLRSFSWFYGNFVLWVRFAQAQVP